MCLHYFTVLGAAFVVIGGVFASIAAANGISLAKSGDQDPAPKRWTPWRVACHFLGFVFPVAGAICSLIGLIKP